MLANKSACGTRRVARIVALRSCCESARARAAATAETIVRLDWSRSCVFGKTHERAATYAARVIERSQVRLATGTDVVVQLQRYLASRL